MHENKVDDNSADDAQQPSPGSGYGCLRMLLLFMSPPAGFFILMFLSKWQCLSFTLAAIAAVAILHLCRWFFSWHGALFDTALACLGLMSGTCGAILLVKLGKSFQIVLLGANNFTLWLDELYLVVILLILLRLLVPWIFRSLKAVAARRKDANSP